MDFFTGKGYEFEVSLVSGSYSVEFASQLVTSVFDDAVSKVQCSDMELKVMCL